MGEKKQAPQVIQADAEGSVATDGTVEVEYAVRILCQCGAKLKLYSSQRNVSCQKCGETWRVRS